MCGFPVTIYAIEPEDSEIAPGIYSALHYAAKAAASAAGLDLPAIGTAGQVLQVNSGATALENHTPTSTATASAIVRRDASARLQAADPSVDADVATKGYVDSLLESSEAVSGYTKGIARYVKNEIMLPGDGLNVVSEISENTEVTVGPTGSGADYIWTSLDSLPSDAKIITLIYQTGVTDTAAGEFYFELALKGPSTHTRTLYRNWLYSSAGGDAVHTTNGPVEVVLDTGNIFRLRWLSDSDSPIGTVWLSGFMV